MRWEQNRRHVLHICFGIRLCIQCFPKHALSIWTALCADGMVSGKTCFGYQRITFRAMSYLVLLSLSDTYLGTYVLVHFIVKAISPIPQQSHCLRLSVLFTGSFFSSSTSRSFECNCSMCLEIDLTILLQYTQQCCFLFFVFCRTGTAASDDLSTVVVVAAPLSLYCISMVTRILVADKKVSTPESEQQAFMKWASIWR